jgi:hypothetical protein
MCGLMLSGNFSVSSNWNFGIHLRQKRDKRFLREPIQCSRAAAGSLSRCASMIVFDAGSRGLSTVTVRFDAMIGLNDRGAAGSCGRSTGKISAVALSQDNCR